MSLGEGVGQFVVVIGCVFFLAGTVGLMRFPDTYCRLHALTKADNVGLGLICLGLAFHDGTWVGGLKLLLVWLLALASASVSAYLLADWTEEPQGPTR